MRNGLRGFRMRGGQVGLRAAAAAVTGMLAACDGRGPLAPGGSSALQILVAGRMERGATLALRVSNAGADVPTDAVTWTLAPGGPARLLPPDSVQLTDTGTTSITARVGGIETTLRVHASAPPTIVFDMHDAGANGAAGNRDVYRAALDGRDVVRLTSGAGDNEQPTTARGAVVFTSYRDGYPALYRVSIAGGVESRLAAVPGPAYQPALSPDGSRLAFIASDSGDDKLWVGAADGSGASRATSTFGSPSAEEAAPAWDAAGSSLAFVSTTFGDAAVVSLAVPSDSARAITDGTTTDVDPAWSPDGRQIAFSSTRDGDVGIFVVTVATGAVQRVSPRPSSAGQPTWLSDGRIIFTSWTVTSGVLTSQLCWIDASTPAIVHAIALPAGDPEYARAAK